MNIIPINDLTIDMITTLNNGVRPKQNEDTYFVWYSNESAEIVSGYRIRLYKPQWKTIEMIFIKDY